MRLTTRRLLNAIKSTSVLGVELEERLADEGTTSGFLEALAMRSETRSLAASPTALAAIISSARATNSIFAAASINNSTAAQAVVLSPLAMSMVSNSLPALITVIENSISWKLFYESSFYENNIVTITALFAGRNPSNYSSMNSLIADVVAMAEISISNRAMMAIVQSAPTMAIVVQSTNAMENIATSSGAMNIFANSDLSMNLLSQSPIALSQVTNEARQIVSSIPSAIKIVSSYSAVWLGLISNSSTLESNLFNIITGIADLDKALYFNSVENIFDDGDAMAKIANILPIMQAIVGVPSALTLLTNSPNLGIALANPITVGVLANDTPTLVSLIQNTTAFPLLLASSAAKAAIFSSTAAIDAIAGSSEAISTLTALKLTKIAPALPDALPAVFQTYGIPGKTLILTVVANSIVATFVEFEFNGTPQFGSNAGAVIQTPGTSLSSGPVAHIAAYTDLTWNVRAIAATAGAQPTITYVDFN